MGKVAYGLKMGPSGKRQFEDEGKADALYIAAWSLKYFPKGTC